jgi:serine phosphatase RsbU (regulator of sigma subunit)
MFDDKKAGWAPAVGIALVLEVFHMLMIFITNMDEAYDAFLFVKQCTIPMIIANAVSVGLSIFIITLISKEKVIRSGKDKGIAQTFQRWLLACIILAYAVTSIFTYNLQTGIAESQVEENFTTSMTDVVKDVKTKSDSAILNVARKVKEIYENNDGVDLNTLLQGEDVNGDRYEICEINIVGSDGVIKKSTDPSIINFDFYDKLQSTAQSEEFLALLGNKESLVQEFKENAKGEFRKYAGLKLKNDQGFMQVAYNQTQFKKKIDGFIIDVTKNRHVGATGFIAVCDEELKIVSETAMNNHHVSEIGIIPSESMKNGEFEEKIFETEIINPYNNKSQGEYIFVYTFKEGYCIIAAMPTEEVTIMRDVSIMLSTFMQVLIFALLFLILYLLIKNIIINNLHVINSKLAQISDGNLDVTVDVRANQEFASLSDDINSTVATLKRYIAEAAARIDKELEYAKQIQLSALPTNFPKNEEYGIYAQMIAAKEVGGDFYDFYKLNENTVAFLVADVSGKGIPAAMFMMTAKTIIKDLAESGMAVNEIFTKANEKLCENNESGMFVTAWMGILDITTGKMQFTNAGHNPPLIKKANGTFEYLKTRAGFVLAGMEGVRYRAGELTLGAGDRLFLYTDGVPEATNAENKLYGENRLLSFMNENLDLEAVEILPKLKTSIDQFVGNAPQFDDITMLTFDYKRQKGGANMIKNTFPAKTEALLDVLAFVEQALEKHECPMKIQTAICVAIEEVFVNVAHYAYGDGEGDVTLTIDFEEENRNVIIQMTDKGVAFDPLKKPDPDITLSAEEREIGGLGIFITKKTMDLVTYAYKNGENILTMRKKI